MGEEIFKTSFFHHIPRFGIQTLINTHQIPTDRFVLPTTPLWYETKLPVNAENTSTIDNNVKTNPLTEDRDSTTGSNEGNNLISQQNHATLALTGNRCTSRTIYGQQEGENPQTHQMNEPDQRRTGCVTRGTTW
jgi:lipoate synthase